MHLFDPASASTNREPAVFRLVPPPAAPLGRSGCRHGPSLLLYSPWVPGSCTQSQHIKPRHFKTLCHFPFLSQIRRNRRLLQVSGVKVTSGHVCIFVCFCQDYYHEGPNDSTTRSATQKPCTDHTDFLGVGCVFWSYNDIFTSMFSNNNLSLMPKKYTVIYDLL